MASPDSSAIADFLVKDYYKVPVEIDTIQCADSLNGTSLVQVAGWMQTKKADVRRKFSHALLVGREGKGYYVVTDIVDYHQEEAVVVKPTVVQTEGKAKLTVVQAEPKAKPTVVQAEPKVKPPSVVQPETVEKVSTKKPETVEKPIGVRPYSSIVALASPMGTRIPTPAAVKPSKLLLAAQQAAPEEKEKEGQTKTVRVSNLPTGSKVSEVLHNFKDFGKIKKGGVTLRTIQDTGRCYGFVDFEDVESANKAVQASPLKRYDGRNVYIELKRSTKTSTTGGRGNANTTTQQH